MHIPPRNNVSTPPVELSRFSIILGLLALPGIAMAAPVHAQTPDVTPLTVQMPLSASSINGPQYARTSDARMSGAPKPGAPEPGAPTPATIAAPGSLPDNAVTRPTPYSRAAHDALIAQRRDGQRSDQATLAQLAQWASEPLSQANRRRIAADGVVVAQAAGQSQQAIDYLSLAKVDDLPDYALPAAYQAARGVGERNVQGQVVQQLRARQPDAWQPRIMEALWLTDIGEYARAQSTLDALSVGLNSRSREARVQWLEASGALNEARRRPIEAIGDYQDVLTLDPDHRYALRERVFLLARTAAPAAQDLATAQVRKHPGLFTDLELAALQQQALAQRLRWAIVERDQKFGYGVTRFAALDAVLEQYDAQIPTVSAAAEASQAWRDIALDMEYDRILGLSARGRHGDVLRAYDSLVARGIAPPYYVSSAAAGAYQHHRRSDLAVPLYEAALRDGKGAIPVPSDTHIGLVYAYIDTARFEQAEALLQQLEAATPPLLRLTPVQGQANAQYSQIRHLRALTQLYTDHPAKAERSFDVLTSMAPLNASFRSGEAETAALREQPERALDLYKEALTDNPDDAAVRAGYASALMGAGYLREGRERSETLQSEAPQSIEARRTARDGQTISAPRFDVRADGGRGGEFSNRDWRVDTRLTSGLIDDQWRVYYRQVLARADLDDDDTQQLARSGLGLQWQRGRWTAAGEIHRANRGHYRTGVAGEVTYRASDAWRLSAEFDSSSLDTPYKARRADIGARSAALGATYIVNESRSYTASLRRMDFSDGNERNGVGLAWRERWLTGPRWQFETTLGADTGTSSKDDTPYFSPRNETTVGVDTRTQYLTWKRDDRRMLQVLNAGAGAYRQSGEGTGPRWSLGYSHEWIIGNSYQLSYGIGISRHPYDGEQEMRRNVFLNLSVPLQ